MDFRLGLGVGGRGGGREEEEERNRLWGIVEMWEVYVGGSYGWVGVV